MTRTGAAAASDVAAGTTGRRALPFAKIGIGLTALGALVWLGREVGDYVPRFAEWVEEIGPWGPAAFVAGSYTVVGLGFAATAIVTILVTRVARRALKEATGE